MSSILRAEGFGGVVELEGELDNIRDYAKNALLEGSLNLNSDAVEAIIRQLRRHWAKRDAEAAS